MLKKIIPQNRQNSRELRNNTDFTLPLVESVLKGLESFSCLGPKTWEILPVEIKQTESLLQNLSELKVKIKDWNLRGFLCRLRKVYL